MYKRNDKELARAYIKIQYYHKRWDPIKGLIKGTIFPELYRPYYPREFCDPEPHVSMQSTYQTKFDSPKNAQLRGGKRHVQPKETHAY